MPPLDERRGSSFNSVRTALPARLVSSWSALMFGLPGQWEWLLILMLGVLLYGRRLPEAGRTLGRTVTEFRKAVSAIAEEPPRPASRRDPPAPPAPPAALPVAGAPPQDQAAASRERLMSG